MFSIIVARFPDSCSRFFVEREILCVDSFRSFSLRFMSCRAISIPLNDSICCGTDCWMSCASSAVSAAARWM